MGSTHFAACSRASACALVRSRAIQTASLLHARGAGGLRTLAAVSRESGQSLQLHIPRQGRAGDQQSQGALALHFGVRCLCSVCRPCSPLPLLRPGSMLLPGSQQLNLRPHHFQYAFLPCIVWANILSLPCPLAQLATTLPRGYLAPLGILAHFNRISAPSCLAESDYCRQMMVRARWKRLWSGQCEGGGLAETPNPSRASRVEDTCLAQLRLGSCLFPS